MAYNKSFRAEERYLRRHGMTPDQIESFYLTWRDQFNSDVRFELHTVRFSEDEDDGSLIEDSVAVPKRLLATEKQITKNNATLGEEGADPWEGYNLKTYSFHHVDRNRVIFFHSD